MRSPKIATLLQNTALLLGSVLAFMLLMEAALRLVNAEGSIRFTRPDNIFHHRFREGIKHRYRTIEFESTVSINSLGFRDEEFDIPKPAGTYRIAVLGDSFCAALQVPLEETFHSILEKSLSSPQRKVELVNLGVVAYGNFREWLTYRLYAKKLEVDAVLWLIFPYNDPLDNADFVNKGFTRPDDPDFLKKTEEASSRLPDSSPRKRLNLWLDEHSYLYRWQKSLSEKVSMKIKQITGNVDPRVKDPLLLFTEPNSPSSAQKWALTREALEGFMAELGKDGVPVIPVLFMPRLAIEEDYLKAMARKAGLEANGLSISMFSGKVKELENILRDAGGGPVDIAHALRDAWKKNGIPLFYEIDGHWTPEGHRIVAKELEAPLKGVLNTE